MTHEQMLAFVHKQTKLGLEHVQHLEAGGVTGPDQGGVQQNAVDPKTSGASGIWSGVNPVGTMATDKIGQQLGGSKYGGMVSNALDPIGGLMGSMTDKFQASGANLQQGTNADQLNSAYSGVQGALGQQQNLVNQFQPGVNQGIGSQGYLNNALMNQMNGNGPSVAQSALNQSTGQNIEQQAALMAGQRGAGGNAGLMATQAARQGAATQQQAVGQGATLRAQEQLAAQQQLQNLSAQQIGQGATGVQNLNQQQQNEQNILQGANTSYNNANVAMQSNINNTNSQTAAANQNMAANTMGGIMGGASSVMSMFAHGGLVKMDQGGNVLDANARKHIKPENFALPGRRYPIHDINHARNALARVSQNGTSAEKAKVKAAVAKKYPGMGAKKMADGGEVEGSEPSDEAAPAPVIQDTEKSDTPAFQPTASNVSSGPSVPSTASLPADQTNFADSMGGGKSGGGGGGGGAGLGSLAMLALNKGGHVGVHEGYMKMMAQGGYMSPTPLAVDQSAPQSFVGQWVNSNVTPSNGPTIGSTAALPADQTNFASSMGGGKKKDKKAGGADDLTAADTNGPGTAMAGGPMDEMGGAGLGGLATMVAYKGGLAATGGNVKANDKSQKAQVKGDSLKNDKIPAMLSQGEVVMDRDTLNDPGPVGQMARAVAKHIEQRNKKK